MQFFSLITLFDILYKERIVKVYTHFCISDADLTSDLVYLFLRTLTIFREIQGWLCFLRVVKDFCTKFQKCKIYPSPFGLFCGVWLILFFQNKLYFFLFFHQCKVNFISCCCWVQLLVVVIVVDLLLYLPRIKVGDFHGAIFERKMRSAAVCNWLC